MPPVKSLTEWLGSWARLVYSMGAPAAVVAIRSPDGGMVFNPSGDTKIDVGDLLIVIGRAGSLTELAALARGEKVSAKPKAWRLADEAGRGLWTIIGAWEEASRPGRLSAWWCAARTGWATR